MEAMMGIAREYGYMDGRLGRVACKTSVDDGRPALVLAYPYSLNSRHGDAAISSYYFASQAAYVQGKNMLAHLAQAGFACHMAKDVPLKPLALETGLGVLGRNSLVMHKTYGSCMVLAAVVLEFELETQPAQPVQTCADCGACRRACPGGALDAFGNVCLDACLRAHMFGQEEYPLHLRGLLKNRVLGCDNCLLACPANKGSIVDEQNEKEPSLAALLTLSPQTHEGLRQAIGTNYARKTRLLSAAFLACANSGRAEFLPLLEPYTHHENALLRSHSRWAMEMIHKSLKLES